MLKPSQIFVFLRKKRRILPIEFIFLLPLFLGCRLYKVCQSESKVVLNFVKHQLIHIFCLMQCFLITDYFWHYFTSDNQLFIKRKCLFSTVNYSFFLLSRIFPRVFSIICFDRKNKNVKSNVLMYNVSIYVAIHK